MVSTYITRPFLLPCALVLAFCGSLALHPASAQSNELARHPGYAEFDMIPDAIEVEPNIEVYLKGALLRLAAEASRIEDPEFAVMLNKLQAIRVFGYEPDRRWSRDVSNSLYETSRAIARSLEDQNWDLAARVREDDELVYIYIREIDETLQGMVVMAIEEDEAIFVNIVGEIDPAQIGRLGRKFDIGVLEEMRIDP